MYEFDIKPPLYVCVCRRVTEEHIKQAVRDGCTCLYEVQQVLPVAYGCRLCQREAEDIIDRTIAEMKP